MRGTSTSSRRTITTTRASVHNGYSGVENSLSNNVCHTKYLTSKFFFFSASSFYPGHHHNADIPTQNSDNEDVTDAGDTEVESVDDWLTDPEVPEPIDMEPA